MHASRRPSPLELLALAFVVLATVGVVVHFFDRFWWAPDEGVYAYVAGRIVGGDVLYRDVQDLHAGYVQLLNAAAFALLGIDLISLRYPLALVTVLQAGLVFLLLRPRGPLVAVSGGLAAAALTFVQFLNPTANWYALFVAVVATTVLAWPSRSAGRLVALGFLLGVLFLVRQLTGVLFAMGALTYLLYEAQAAAAAPVRRAVLSRALVAVMAVGLAGYLVANAEALRRPVVWPLAAADSGLGFRQSGAGRPGGGAPDRLAADRRSAGSRAARGLPGHSRCGGGLAARFLRHGQSHDQARLHVRAGLPRPARACRGQRVATRGCRGSREWAVLGVPGHGATAGGSPHAALPAAPRSACFPRPGAPSRAHRAVLRPGVGAFPDPDLPVLFRRTRAVGASLACRRVAAPGAPCACRRDRDAEHGRAALAGRPTAVAWVGRDRRWTHRAAGCAGDPAEGQPAHRSS